MFIVLDNKGDVSHINQKGCSILEYKKRDIIGKNWFDNFIPPEQRKQVKSVYKKLMKGEIKPVEYYENVVLTASGLKRIISFHNTVLRNTYGEIVGTLSSGEDITDRKKSERQIKKDLEEKKVLLKELYHRTKNNMQIICSMLQLQSDIISNIEIQKIFRELETKIMSMALVHQRLYESGDLSSLNLKNYLSDLIMMIRQSYMTEKHRINLFCKSSDISVSIETAIPLGLVINELLTNAIKYAFTDKNEGTIDINLGLSKQKGIHIEVRDNGRGFPSGFNLDKDSRLGLKTVTSIVEHQLDGDISFRNEGGLCCKIDIRSNSV